VNSNTLTLIQNRRSQCLNTVSTREAGPTMAESTNSDTSGLKRARYIELVNPVKKMLYNFIFKSMNFNQDGDDIFQEALLKGFKYFHSYNPEKNFKSWLFTIANNLIKDYYRKNKLNLPLESNHISDREDQTLSLKVIDIYHAVGELKPHHRRVFFLFYYSEFKITEISTITGLSQSNIKFILSQSRKRLKKFLEVPE
jgi:RNA polymerase sigma-70 factor (ECF subfamily)